MTWDRHENPRHIFYRVHFVFVVKYSSVVEIKCNNSFSHVYNQKDPTLDRWIVPIIQGYIQHETCDVSQFEVLGPEVSTQY